MKEHDYKRLFIIVSAVCMALVGALAYLLWGAPKQRGTSTEESSIVVAQGPQTPSMPVTTAPTSDAPLSPIQLPPERLQTIGVRMAAVEMRNVTDKLRAPGNVAVNERQLAYVQTRFPGWIQKVYANAPYQYVRRGQPLFTIYSPELVSTEQEYLLARKNQQAFATDMHGAAAQEGDWLLQAATDRLRQFGVPPSEVTRLEQSGTVLHDIPVDAPVSGYVTEYNALPNQQVQPETRLYTIADLSSVWVVANVFQNDIAGLRPGTPAVVTVDAYPGRTFHGRIEQVLPQVDPGTRTVPVRFLFSNPGVALKPGMYVDVAIAVPLGRRIVIPASGVLSSGTRQVAFVDHGEGRLEPREIQVERRLDDQVVVASGLKPGERIVSSAGFLIDSESQLQAALGSFAPLPATPAPQPGKAPSVAPKATVALTTEPSPPRKGSNTARVTLTGSDGKGVSGAEVTVTFVMPPMPAMGMPGSRIQVKLQDRGSGVYEGPFELSSGGGWTVTINATRDGQTLASKQLTLSATGGM